MKNWEEYLSLRRDRPELFWGYVHKKPALNVVFNEDIIKNFEEASGREIGIMSIDDPYRRLVVDLLENPTNGKLFAYSRIVNLKGGIAILPVYDDGIILINQYRHPNRDWSWEIPRGFSEDIKPNLDDAIRELEEETGITPPPFNFHFLGVVMPDSGIIANKVDVYLAMVSDVSQLSTDKKDDNECIAEVKLFSSDQIKKMVKKGEIQDSFTLSALTMYFASKST